MQIELTSAVLQQLQQEAALSWPEECCGLLLGSDGGERHRIERLQPSPNLAADRQRHFEIDPQILISAHRSARAGGDALIGYYHSHPNGAPQPSATDRAMAAGDGKIWAIIAQGDVTFWHDDGGRFVPLPYRLREG